METAIASHQLPRTIDELRGDFPLLARKLDGQSITYIDNAATSQKPRQVLDAMDDYYREHNANIHRGIYTLAQEATELFEAARKRVATFVGATPKETIFVRNATEAINLVAYSWGRAHIDEGDTVLITLMEHHSNIVPWQILSRERGAHLKYVSISDDGTLDLDELERYLEGGVKLVALNHISNVLGTINPIKQIVSLAHLGGAKVLVDGAQSVPQVPVDVKDLDADFYVFTGHKMLGPTGIGVLYGRRELLEEMPPFLGGGDMIKSVDLYKAEWNDLPWKFEAGTSAIAEAVGLGAAVDYLAELGMKAIRSHELDVTAYALELLEEVKGLKIFGLPSVEGRGGVISFAIDGMHPHDVSELVNREGVCIRAGHHCAQPLMRHLGIPSTARASFAVYNNREDVDRLVEALEKAKRVFQIDGGSSTGDNSVASGKRSRAKDRRS